ncbi:MAG: hypothetical protein AB1505_11795 [Candidatus Latescibacterota bacterium]
MAVGGQEWLLQDRTSTLVLTWDARQRRYLLAAIQGAPICGLSTPAGQIDIPAGSAVEGKPVTTSSAVTEGSLGEGCCGGSGGSGYDRCIGAIPFARRSQELPGTNQVIVRYFAGIDIDPYTGACRLRHDDQGQALIFEVSPEASGDQIVCFPDRLVGNWEFGGPGPAGGPGVSTPVQVGTEQTV